MKSSDSNIALTGAELSN